MPKRTRPEDLSVEQLRRLLIEKRRGARQDRLEQFRRTGRAVRVSPDLPAASLGDMRASPVVDTGEADAPALPPRRRWADRILLGVEVLAVIGLIGVVVNGLGILRALNQEVAAALEQPTMAPTPLITAVVLPAGHIPPGQPGEGGENFAEIPAHLQPIFQSLKNLPVPTPSVQQATGLTIPALDLVNTPIVQGDGWEQLRKGVGQHIGSANPGQPGNLVLSAHNDVHGEIFRYLDRLKPGDSIIVYTQQRQYVYIVTGTQIVEPTRVDVMAPTADATITLISCYPYMIDNQRIVVFGKLQP